MDNKERIDFLINRSYALVQKRPRTEREIRDYLLRKKENSLVIEAVIEALKSKKLIDDNHFIKWWVEQRSYFKPRGIRALKAELRQRGINKELLDSYFEDENINELELAKNELKRVRRRFDALSPQDKYRKSVQYLLRRGFPFALARKAFEDLYQIE